jgi:hypothetical protein
MGKYQPLNDHLTKLKGDFVSLSFSKIETIISDKLPNSAFKYRAWWDNDKTHVQAAAWMGAICNGKVGGTYGNF